MNCCLTEQAQEIIDKYHTDQVEEDYIFPILDRLNEEQNIRFNEMLCKAELEHNRSRFIVKRIFSEHL